MQKLYVRDGKWHASDYYWDERAGKRRRWRVSTGVADDGSARAKRVAEQCAYKISQSYATGAVRRARALTLAKALDYLVAAYELAGKKQATIDIAIEKAEQLYGFFGADVYVHDIASAERLTAYAQHRRAMPGKRKGSRTAPGTIHRELLTLTGALQESKRIGKYDGPIPELPDLGEIYTPRERWLPTAETKLLLLAVIPRWRDHVVMIRQLGLDEGELYSIEPSDINWGARELLVRGTKTKWRKRVLPLTDEICEILGRRAKHAPMFEPWTNNNRDLALACSKAGVERCCLKDLRRSFATEMAILGTPILFLKDLMGHSSTRMLERVYARVARGQHMHDAIGRLPQIRPVAPARAQQNG